jgi:hypothetical protein
VTRTDKRPARLVATTVRRRDERSRIPTCGETKVAIAAGLDPTRNLAQSGADYYLLAHLRMPHYLPEAAERLEDLASELAQEFTTYLDLACGGELRHASTWPYELPSCPVLGRGSDRSVAWKDWLAWETPTYRMEYAVQAFEEASWPSRNYGGEPWMLIASTVLAFLRKEMSSEVFVDRVWNLEHHGGISLNKVYATDELATVLEAHGKDDYETLLSYSSDTVKHLWEKAFDKKTFNEACASVVLWTRLRDLIPTPAYAAKSQ